MADEKGHDVTNVPSIIDTWVNELKLKKIIDQQNDSTFIIHDYIYASRLPVDTGNVDLVQYIFCEINITRGFYEAMATLPFRNLDEEDI